MGQRRRSSRRGSSPGKVRVGQGRLAVGSGQAQVLGRATAQERSPLHSSPDESCNQALFSNLPKRSTPRPVIALFLHSALCAVRA